MRRRIAEYPVQSRIRYFRRVVKYAALKGCSARIVFSALVAVCRWQGWDYDRLVNSTVRGYARREDFYRQIRQRPSTPLLKMITRRVRGYDAAAASRRTERGRALARRLDGAVVCPGAQVSPHTFWVFPILVDEPRELMQALLAEGFDATQGQSMCNVSAPAGREETTPHDAEYLLEHIVYLPFYPSMPEEELDRMAQVVSGHCGKPPVVVSPGAVSPVATHSTTV
jgi:dTDP-4-amino-4,6-dideoxygalactose transaminase